MKEVIEIDDWVIDKDLSVSGKVIGEDYISFGLLELECWKIQKYKYKEDKLIESDVTLMLKNSAKLIGGMEQKMLSKLFP